MKKIFALLVLSTFICASAYADSITLKSGKKLEGSIVERNADWVKVDANGVKLTYFLDEIDNINGEKVQTAAKEVVVPAVSEQGQVTKPQALLQPVTPADNKIMASNPGLPQIDTGLALIYFALFFVFGYLYPSLCLQFIAVKTNHHPVWLAWVPVGNLFLMCKIAGISYLWLLSLLLIFIPYAGMLVNLALGGYIWFKIAEARNKPGWVGVLAVIPVIGLAVFAYLAFSE